ncbi:MAG TPA: hypothetical protein VIF12_04895 [Micavibrio sp.]|jgi:hypothetical protein
MFRISDLWKVSAFLFVLHCAHPAAAQQAGTREYNYVTHQMKFYDGSQWYNFGIGAALGACANEGSMEYDPLVITSYKYCNGTNWIKVVGIPTLAFCSSAGAMDFDGSTYLVCNGLVWTNIKGILAS